MVFGNCTPEDSDPLPNVGDGDGDVTAAERARQREIASYLTAASVNLSTPRFDPAANLPPKCSPDPSLTALVQLGALRLDCDRSFLSLIDGTTQYIVAEATRTTPLTTDATPEQSGLYLGVVLLEASWGVCPNTMKVFTDEKGVLAADLPNISADTTHYIIRDFQADEHYKNRPYVAGWPYMRSYAEVPIISPLGYVIGGYCVVDNKLRDFGDETIRVLSEIASTIMAHLENMRINQNRIRSERLIRGLDIFIQEETAVRQSRSASSRSTSIARSSKNGSASTQPSVRNTKRASPSEAGSIDTASSKNGSSIQQFAIQRPDEDQITSDQASISSKTSSEPDDVRKAFQRSASLIREAMGMDGLIFLDACPVGFASRQPLSNAFDLDPFRSSQDDLLDFTPSTKPSPVLAASISGNESDSFEIPEGLLFRMIRRFKQGHVFTADEHGPFEKRSTPVGQDQLGKKAPAMTPMRRDSTGPKDTQELFEFLPEARSIIFLPLWHLQREKWFAAALGWTSDPTKSFDPSDATYLNAFGNSIMAEVLRLETLAVSKAKSDFISSISHELRSPLHGILATSELLGELLNSSEERNLLNMLRSCGITLLDTMNHLLDYAKINSLALTRNPKTSLKAQKTKNIFPIGEVTDLSKLVEDVVESVVIGHGFENGNRNEMKPGIASSLAKLGVTEIEPEIPVLIMIDIAANVNWNFNINTGAWRRIVMNLFGNAMKYTPNGRIEVILKITQQSSGPHVLFRVKDTGIGMDKDYQKYKLFQPFAQENSLSAGTGLGLCIVQQIVQSLGGTIDVQSERGIGTMITVLVPLQTENTQSSEEQSTFLPLLKRLEGLEIGFINKESSYLNGDEPFGTAGTVEEYHKALQSSLANIARDWLKMKVKSGLPDEVNANFYVVDNSIPFESFESVSHLSPLFMIYSAASSKATGALNIKLPIGPRKFANALINALDLPPKPVGESEMHFSADDTFSPVISSPDMPMPSPPEGSSEESVTSMSDNSVPTTFSTATSSTSTDLITPLPTYHHVLLVDDNAINLKILITLIKRIGCTHLAACNGLEAVQLFKAASVTQPFSFVFMDISMPVMDGFTATREIRAYEAETDVSNSVHIVALTGLGSTESEKEAFESGMDMFLTKPVSLAKLKELLIVEE